MLVLGGYKHYKLGIKLEPNKISSIKRDVEIKEKFFYRSFLFPTFMRKPTTFAEVLVSKSKDWSKNEKALNFNFSESYKTVA